MFRYVDEENIMTTVTNLSNKTSCGIDVISPKLLIKSFTILSNQILRMSNAKLQIAKVFPIYKGETQHNLIIGQYTFSG